jgi:hypothetical protein
MTGPTPTPPEAVAEVLEMCSARNEACDLAAKLVCIKSQLAGLGLLGSVRALDEATRVLGHEIAQTFPRQAAAKARASEGGA